MITDSFRKAMAKIHQIMHIYSLTLWKTKNSLGHWRQFSLYIQIKGKGIFACILDYEIAEFDCKKTSQVFFKTHTFTYKKRTSKSNDWGTLVQH